MREHQTEVLVVGAGPAGLFTAIVLANAGVKVEVIDREERGAARSYACALHPQTLELLDDLGIAEPLQKLGRRVRKITFHDGPARKAEADLASLGSKFPFLLVLPQSDLELVLENKLNRSGVPVKWNHRFDQLRSDGDSVAAIVEELEGTSLGYIVPHWETVVKRRFSTHARFVVGADGHNSMVRRRLGINFRTLGPTETYVACEFNSDTLGPDELRIVLDEGTTNVLWPLPDNKMRWTFQLVHTEPMLQFPEKERRAIQSGELVMNESIRKNLLRLSRLRAPWFAADVDEILWCKQVGFQKMLAEKFGSDRVWLVGDAAHQTGPVGVQSLNAGLLEAHWLGRSLEQILKSGGPLSLLSTYNQKAENLWQRLLGIDGVFQPKSAGEDWLQRRAKRILPCLPAVEKHLPIVAEQLGLEFGSATRADSKQVLVPT